MATIACAFALAIPALAWADDAKGSQDSSASAAVLSTKAGSESKATEAERTANDANIADGIYTIGSAIDTSKLIEVPAGSIADSTRVKLYSANTTPAQRWRIKSLGGGLYSIINVNSGKALDVFAQRAKNGTLLQQYAWNNTVAQKWKIEATSGGYIIRSAVNDSYVLDIPAQKATNGQSVQLYEANGTVAQVFKLNAITQEVSNGFYVITNTKSSKSLDIAAGSLSNGGNVQQYSANGTLAQTYEFIYDKNNGYYTLRNAGSGKALDVAGGSVRSGANVQQYTPNKTLAQYWDVKKSSDGSFTIKSAKSGNALDVAAASTRNGANVQIYAPNGTPAQKWNIKANANWLPDGSYFIHSSKNHKVVLTIKDASSNTSANVQVQTKSNSNNGQRFYLRSTGNGYYTIQNTGSGKYVDAVGTSSGSNVVQSLDKEEWKPALANNGIVFQLKSDPNIVLDLQAGKTASGTNVQVYRGNGTIAQKWLLKATVPYADGTYTIACASEDDYVLDIPGQSKESGMAPQVYSANNTIAQRFTLKLVSENGYRITNSGSNKAIQKNGTSVTQEKASNSKSQQWIMDVAEDGAVSIKSAADTSKALSLDGKAANNTKVIASSFAGAIEQLWMIERTGLTYSANSTGWRTGYATAYGGSTDPYTKNPDTTATGDVVDDNSMGVAVPIAWGPSAYYGRTVEIQYNNKTVRAIVNDCGGLGNGARALDLQPGVFKALGFNSTSAWGVRQVKYRFL